MLSLLSQEALISYLYFFVLSSCASKNDPFCPIDEDVCDRGNTLSEEESYSGNFRSTNNNTPDRYDSNDYVSEDDEDEEYQEDENMDEEYQEDENMTRYHEL